jgi:hypothetical protein
MSRVKRIPERHFELLEEPGIFAVEYTIIVLAKLSAQISDLHLQELLAQKPHITQYFLQSIEILADFLKESRAKSRYFIRKTLYLLSGRYIFRSSQIVVVVLVSKRGYLRSRCK